MKIERKIIHVGHSRAVVLPSEWFKSINQPALEFVTLDLKNDRIILTIKNKKGGTNVRKPKRNRRYAGSNQTRKMEIGHSRKT
jgi:antitoxin component of MazEF toxin-antitoxin module